ncbi:DUF924 family protein [Tsuneonella sp. HG222]
MTAARRAWAADLLHFWFHVLEPGEQFASPPAVDEELRRRYGRLWQALRHQPAATFLSNPDTARAAILLFDQVPRNIHRESPLAFASDPLARRLVTQALHRGWASGLSTEERQFLLMPLMHSEYILDQRESLARFTALGDPQITAFASAHHRMIARFGRFPHRNAVLGRKSTPAEKRAVAQGFAW